MNGVSCERLVQNGAWNINWHRNGRFARFSIDEISRLHGSHIETRPFDLVYICRASKLMTLMDVKRNGGLIITTYWVIFFCRSSTVEDIIVILVAQTRNIMACHVRAKRRTAPHLCTHRIRHNRYVFFPFFSFLFIFL